MAVGSVSAAPVVMERVRDPYFPTLGSVDRAGVRGLTRLALLLAALVGLFITATPNSAIAADKAAVGGPFEPLASSTQYQTQATGVGILLTNEILFF